MLLTKFRYNKQTFFSPAKVKLKMYGIVCPQTFIFLLRVIFLRAHERKVYFDLF